MMYRTTETVHGYWLGYGDGDPISTLTQTGLLRFLLSAQNQKRREHVPARYGPTRAVRALALLGAEGNANSPRLGCAAKPS